MTKTEKSVAPVQRVAESYRNDGDARVVSATECSRVQAAVVRYVVVLGDALAAIADFLRRLLEARLADRH